MQYFDGVLFCVLVAAAEHHDNISMERQVSTSAVASTASVSSANDSTEVSVVASDSRTTPSDSISCSSSCNDDICGSIDEWGMFWSYSHQKCYYWNGTGPSTWEVPAVFAGVPVFEGPKTLSMCAEGCVEKPCVTIGGWSEYYQPRNHRCFYSKGNKAMWELPLSFFATSTDVDSNGCCHQNLLSASLIILLCFVYTGI